MITDNRQGLLLAVIRAFIGRCPNCGVGKLLTGYLKPVENCSQCDEAFGHIKADDGPAWMTIMVVGHIIAPLMLAFAPGANLPDWGLVILLGSLALILTLAFLPRAKGFFIAVIWRTGCTGAQK
jgi:uncharacterized protein (DUF983 family)